MRGYLLQQAQQCHLLSAPPSSKYLQTEPSNCDYIQRDEGVAPIFWLCVNVAWWNGGQYALQFTPNIVEAQGPTRQWGSAIRVERSPDGVNSKSFSPYLGKSRTD